MNFLIGDSTIFSQNNKIVLYDFIPQQIVAKIKEKN